MYKSFVGIPRSTSNKIVDAAVGNIVQIIESSEKALKYKIWARRITTFMDNQYLSSLKQEKQLGKAPKCLLTLIRMLYGKECR